MGVFIKYEMYKQPEMWITKRNGRNVRHTSKEKRIINTAPRAAGILAQPVIAYIHCTVHTDNP